MRERVLATAASAWTCCIRAFLSSVEDGSEVDEEEPRKDILYVVSGFAIVDRLRSSVSLSFFFLIFFCRMIGLRMSLRRIEYLQTNPFRASALTSSEVTS